MICKREIRMPNEGRNLNAEKHRIRAAETFSQGKFFGIRISAFVRISALGIWNSEFVENSGNN